MAVKPLNRNAGTLYATRETVSHCSNGSITPFLRKCETRISYFAKGKLSQGKAQRFSHFGIKLTHLSHDKQQPGT
jgi:hypothetical protein